MVGVFGSELGTAAFVALASALAVTLLAGRGRRDPSLGLELGAACYVPYFFAWAPIRLLDLEAWLGYVPEPVGRIVRVVAWLWVLALVATSVWVVRRSSPPSASSSRFGLYLGVAVLALPAVGLVASSVWSARNFALLRPLGRDDRAPDFTLGRIDGTAGQMRLSDLRGKVVLLDFWATWCPPCVAMMPTLHDLYREWQPRGAEFVGIDSDGPAATLDEVRDFLAKHPSPYPIVVDDGKAGGAYRVSSLPHVVIVGRDGKIVRVFLGAVGRQQLERALFAASK
jgi:thiol-disulfide isomerase/thioredoxin